MFDAGDGGSWSTSIHGGMTEVSLKCAKGYRPEDWGNQVSVCTNGQWSGDLSRCIEDKDYCEDGHPKDEDKEAIHGWWECTKTSGAGAHVGYGRKRREGDEDGENRGYNHGHGHPGHEHGHHHHSGHHHESSWNCELKCDDGYQAVLVSPIMNSIFFHVPSL